MKVSQFIDGYKATTKGKEEYINKHIVKNYIPYADKISTCDRIINSSMMTNTEPNVFKMNTPMRKMLFALSIIDLYTDIDINWGNVLVDYDLLDESKLLIAIVSEIDRDEIEHFSSILNMMVDDYMVNNRELVSYIETKIEAMKLGFDALSDVFNSEQVQALISNITQE